MKIDKSTLSKLAHLARIEIPEGEEESLLKDLEEIVTWIEKLDELDTSQTSSMLHMSAEKSVFREDVAQNILSTNDALKNAPDKIDPFFKVPKVLD